MSPDLHTADPAAAMLWMTAHPQALGHALLDRCPDYNSGLGLHPITSINTRRYDTEIIVQPHPIEITAGLFLTNATPKPQYLPQGWTEHIHPEGNPYFYNSTYRVVTNEYLYRRETCDEVTTWCDRIQAKLQRESVQLPESSELFLELNPEGETCNYYFVDHATRCEFWLDSASTDDLDIPNVTSVSHLKVLLESHYWGHIDSFPAHRPLVEGAVDELVNSLASAYGDHLTSQMACFPYGTTEISAMLQVLERFRVTGKDDAKLAWFTARTLSTVYMMKYENFYGEEHARISRDQVRTLESVRPRSLKWKFAYFFIWNHPDAILEGLRGIWVDKKVIYCHWESFRQQLSSELRMSLHLSLALVGVNAIFLTVPSEVSLRASNLASLSSALASATSAICLLDSQVLRKESNASSVALFLFNTEHPISGHHLIALVYALPRGLLYWSIILLVVTVFLIALELPRSMTQLASLLLLSGLAIVLPKMWKFANNGYGEETPSVGEEYSPLPSQGDAHV